MDGAVSDSFSSAPLSYREQLLLDVIYDLESASVAQIQQEPRVGLGYATIRSLLRSLESKGFVRHRSEGRCYVYYASVSRGDAARAAFRHFISHNCEGSIEKAWQSLFELTLDTRGAETVQRLLLGLQSQMNSSPLPRLREQA